MKHQYESEILYHLMERDGFNIPSSVPPYESEIKAYLINQVKQAYPKLTDYEAEWLLYNYTKHLPADFPISSVSNVTNATFENVVPFAFQSAILKGQTLVNLVKKDYYGSTQNGTSSTDSDYVTVTEANEETNVLMILTPSQPLEANTLYTLVILDKGLAPSIIVRDRTNAVNLLKTENSNTLTFTTTDKPCDSLTLYYTHVSVGQKYKHSNNVMIFKGDVSNLTFKNHFTGMQSVKMPALTTTGKNLFDGKLKVGNVQSTDGAINQYTNYMRTTDFIKINANKTITISKLNNSNIDFRVEKVAYYDTNKNFIGVNGELFMFPKTLTPPMGVVYIRVVFCKGHWDTTATEEDFKTLQVQIEEGSSATSYEPYKSNILIASEDVTLRGVGDVQDTLDCLTGEVTERIGEIVLDGSEDENWVYQDATTSCNMYLDVRNLDIRQLLACDKFKIGNALTTVNHSEEQVGLKTTETKSEIVLNINKSKLPEQTADGFKMWLSQNPLTIQYQFTIESVKTVDLKCTDQNGKECYFMPLEGTMHVSTSGNPISPKLDMSVPVEATTQNLASFIDLEVEGE